MPNQPRIRISEERYHGILRWCENQKVAKASNEKYWHHKNKIISTKQLADVLEKNCSVPFEVAHAYIRKLEKDLSPQAIEQRKRKEMEDRLKSNELPKYENGIKQFVEDYLRENNIEIGPGGMIVGEKALTINSEVHLAVSKYNQQITKEMVELGYQRLDNFVIKDAVIVCTREVDDREKQLLKEKIKFDPEIDPTKRNLAKFVRTIRCPLTTQDTLRLDELVMEHMIWQVKRRMFQLPVRDVLACFLFGTQNCGKTTALRKLFKPVERYTFEQDVANATDSRWAFMAQFNYVLNAEELVGMDKQDIDKMKAFVTKTKTTSRILGTHIMSETDQNLSLFGTTNRCISAIIDDDTGMRRWYQIVSIQTKFKKMNFDDLNSVDFLTLWKSVDENDDESPLFRHHKLVLQLQDLQERWRRKSEVEEWLTSTGLMPRKNADEVLKSLDQIVLEITPWLEANSYYKITRHKVRNQLRALQIPFQDGCFILSAPPKKKTRHESSGEALPTTPDSLSEPMDFDDLG